MNANFFWDHTLKTKYISIGVNFGASFAKLLKTSVDLGYIRSCCLLQSHHTNDNVGRSAQKLSSSSSTAPRRCEPADESTGGPANEHNRSGCEKPYI